MNKKPNDEEPETYFNEDGFTVFTAEFLLARGYCCGYGCRHCPYEYMNVKEPRRSALLLQRKSNENK